MKRKILVALFALCSGLMVVFAAEVDKCVQKFNSCVEVCGFDKARCMARGNPVEYCNNGLNQCNAACNKGVKDCQAKSPTKGPATSPSPSAPKKPAKK